MSWEEGSSQCLPRLRQRLSGNSPSIQKQDTNNNGLRRRVTSGGSIRQNGTKTLGGDSTTATDSSFGFYTRPEYVLPDIVVQLLENPIHESIPRTQPSQECELGELRFPLPQSKVDELHEEVVTLNLATVSNMSKEEWMFD